MNKYIINLKSGVDSAGPYVNKYNQNFDSIRFFIDDDMDFSSCHFAVVVSAFDEVCMISEDNEKLVRGTDNEKLCLDWTIGAEVTSADGVIIYQVIAYMSGENGTVDAIWYSPEGRIFVGDSIDTTDYEVSQIGTQPGILMQILSNVSLCKDNTDANKKSIDSLSPVISDHEDRIYFNETNIEKNQEDIKSVNTAVSDVSLRLSVDEELTQKNALDIAYNSMLIAENEESISLANSQISLIKQDLFMSNDSISKIRADVDGAENSIAQIKAELSDYDEKVLKNEKSIASCIDKENELEEQILNVSAMSGENEIAIDTHISDISNPHRVSASQIGLDNVDNTSDMDKPLSNAAKEEFKIISDKIEGLGDSIFQTKSEVLDYLNEIRITFPYQNKAVDSRGNLIDYTGAEITDYIDLENVGRIYKYGYSALLNVYAYCFYDENYNLLQYCPRYTPQEFSDINGHARSIEYEIVEGARYIRIVNEMIRTNFSYVLVPKTKIYHVDETLLDKATNFLFHSGDTIVNLGDSIFGNNDTFTSLSHLISTYTNSTVFNCAFGGTRMSTRISTTTGYDKFDFSTLVDAIVSNDYSLQEEAVSSYNLPTYYASRLENLKNIDFNETSIVTLNYGTNDYTSGVSKSIFKEETIEAISKLQAKFPHINVVLITPSWRCWLDDSGTFLEDSNARKYNELTLKDFVEADTELSKELNIPLIDVYNIGINKNNWSYFFDSTDTTHQNENGRIKLAQVISRALTLVA